MNPLILPGGRLVAGMGGYVAAASFGDSGNGDAADRLDVKTWQLQRIYRNAECPHSGTWGAIGRRRVGLDYAFRLQVEWDADNPPDYLLQEADSISICLRLGSVNPINPVYENDAEVKRYVSPSALIDDATTLCDSTGTKIIGQDVTGHGNSLIFLLPEDKDWYDQYVAYLRSRNWDGQ